MAENNFNESIQALLSGLDGLLTSKTIIGEPIKVNDSVILPLMDVSIGVGAGAYGKEKSKSTAGGMSAKLSPSAVLVIHNGVAKLVNIKNQDAVTRILDMVPEVLNKFAGNKYTSDPAVDEEIDKMKEEANSKEDAGSKE